MKASPLFNQFLNSHSGAPLSFKPGAVVFRSWLNRAWAIAARILIPSNEPRISLKVDRNGQQCWHVHDPGTGHSARLSSELEVRIWLEEVLTIQSYRRSGF